jgi:3-methyladenine DNA glycosylase/8-oxoguanine DNA glycosylase
VGTPAFSDAGLVRRWRPPYPLDLLATTGPLRRGPGDPTNRLDPAGASWRAVRTPCGPGTLLLRRSGSGEVVGQAWGDGASWLLDGLPLLLGSADDPSSFVAHHSVVTEAVRRSPGLRLPRTGLVFEQLVPAILEQKVTGKEAFMSWRQLATRFGSAAPGPGPSWLRVGPSPRRIREIQDWEWHRCGIDGARRHAIRAAAVVADRLEEAAGFSPVDAVARLRVVPGVGLWTAAEVVQRTLGAADVVSVGDYHLPSVVGWALTGQKLDDDGMLKVLAPYEPHRQRAVRLVLTTGLGPPRRGPRMTVRSYRSF